MSTVDVPVAGITPDQLDDYLSSDRSPPDCMMMSDLDGFLTGLAVGPSVVVPSEWLPVVWGGEGPLFDDESEMRGVMGGIFSRYNEILRQVEDGAVAPLFWNTTDDIVIAADWAVGFLLAMRLRWEEWQPLIQSRKHAVSLFPIFALCCDETADPLLRLDPGTEDLMMKEAPALIPSSVLEIARFWRRRGPGRAGTPRAGRTSGAARLTPPARPTPKVGRNDPCPCGSGKKFKKCCGQ